jgi:hypothetical protein
MVYWLTSVRIDSSRKLINLKKDFYHDHGIKEAHLAITGSSLQGRRGSPARPVTRFDVLWFYENAKLFLLQVVVPYDNN